MMCRNTVHLNLHLRLVKLHPETNSQFAPEKMDGWLEDDSASFLGKQAYFQLRSVSLREGKLHTGYHFAKRRGKSAFER